MRNLQLFLLTIPLAWICSCGYQVDNPENAIVGEYEVQSISITDCDDSTENANQTDLAFQCRDAGSYSVCTSITVEFTRDRNYIFSRNRIQIDKTIGTALHERDPKTAFYWIEGNELSLCYDGDCIPASFNVEGKTLHLQISKPNGCIENITAIRK